MLSLRQARKAMRWAVDSPSLLFRQINRLYYTRLNRRDFNPDGIDVMAEDWENLIVLDACRYDLFKSHHDLPGELSARESRAAHTSEFILGNFHERDLTDTVYVTASPILQRGYPERYNPEFHAVVNVWQEDGWDDEWNSVLPETMVEYAVDAAERYPKKRLIVHFMQPHYPFIGSDLEIDKQSIPDPEKITTDIWYEMMQKNTDLSRDEILDAYRTNLEIVLPHVEQLLSSLDGKSVVTSDHGNTLGNRARPIPIREWGHPKGIYMPDIVTVPWLEYCDGSRREIISDPPVAEESNVEDDIVKDRLRQLGYAK